MERTKTSWWSYRGDPKGIEPSVWLPAWSFGREKTTAPFYSQRCCRWSLNPTMMLNIFGQRFQLLQLRLAVFYGVVNKGGSSFQPWRCAQTIKRTSTSFWRRPIWGVLEFWGETEVGTGPHWKLFCHIRPITKNKQNLGQDGSTLRPLEARKAGSNLTLNPRFTTGHRSFSTWMRFHRP